MKFKPFQIRTCEAISNSEEGKVLFPLSDSPLAPFPIHDPFGLRKAVVPVFKRDMDGDLVGMGTAFHIDGWGTFLTGDHVIDFARENTKNSKDWKDLSPTSSGEHAILLLGLGLIFGSPTIPDEAFALVEHISQFIREKDDPLAILKHHQQSESALDLATMKVIFQPKNNTSQCVPVRVHGWHPSKGDIVLAIGFSELNCEKLSDSEQKAFLTEGMYGCYGRIRKIHPQGTSSTNSTPVIEVDGYWPSGMSGGPVFNSSGEVIGVVSRSIEPDGDFGVSYATYFDLIPSFEDLTPTIDLDNPMWRRGWAVLNKENELAP